MRDRPNIIYIMSDDHAANAISAYGSRLSQVFHTPNIDRLAEEGAIFTSCHCTNAICTPSRATILTGLYSHTNGVRTLSDSLSPEHSTFPELFKEQGYQTAVVGKWHLGCKPKGFDRINILPGQGKYVNPYFLSNDGDFDYYEKNPHAENQGTAEEGYVTDLITQKCINWLGQVDDSKPFLLLCHHKAPHDFFEYAERYEHLLDGVEIPEPDSLWEDKSHRCEGSRAFGTTVSPKNSFRNMTKTVSQKEPSPFCPVYPNGPIELGGLSDEEKTKRAYQKYLRDYLRCVAGIDDSVGEILKFLDKKGLAENTLVIYTSDQGMFLGEHDYIDKRWIYEESLKMPLLMRYPKKIKPHTQIERMVSNLDFAKTLLDISAIPVPSSMQGKSFSSLFDNPNADFENPLYYRYWMHMAHHQNPAHYGLCTEDYKLIFFYGRPLDASGAVDTITPVGWELYDLRKDPFELHNAYNDPAYREVVTQLKAQLVGMKNAVGDPDSNYPEVERLYKDTL